MPEEDSDAAEIAPAERVLLNVAAPVTPRVLLNVPAAAFTSARVEVPVTERVPPKLPMPEAVSDCALMPCAVTASSVEAPETVNEPAEAAPEMAAEARVEAPADRVLWNEAA